jgi:hypothetical protein
MIGFSGVIYRPVWSAVARDDRAGGSAYPQSVALRTTVFSWV